MWVERYDKTGEFKIVADVKTGAKDKLPIGSFISHIDTTEVMVVEDHEIVDNSGKGADIIVTGRGLETFLENRMIGSNSTFPKVSGVRDLQLPADNTWDQIVDLISEFVLASRLIDDDDSLPYLQVLADVSGTGPIETRSVKFGDVYSAVLSLLSIDKLGIKVVRPGSWSPLGAGVQDTAIVIHKGVDRTAEVIFSHDTGEIERAEYLWSSRNLKNSALAIGKWVQVRYDGPEANFGRRMMYIDASDIDDSYTNTPLGTDFDNIVAAMEQRCIAALASQKGVSLTKTEISTTASKAQYRVDFDVGDLITVSGDYNTSTINRVTEYVEIEDETGRSAYPTLETV
jgi:hypothetical protein